MTQKINPVNQLWLFLYSTPNIAGSVLGLLGLSLFFLGVIKSYWFLIVIGLYLAGYIGWPRNEQLRLTIDNELRTTEILQELEGLIATVSKRVLPEILERVTSIANLVRDLLPQVRDEPRYRHIVVQAATDYLPSMLEHYLNLPTTYARFHPIKNGKTARQLLIEQLVILETEMKSIADDLAAGNAEALIAHGNFLEDKFKSSKSLNL